MTRDAEALLVLWDACQERGHRRPYGLVWVGGAVPGPTVARAGVSPLLPEIARLWSGSGLRSRLWSRARSWSWSRLWSRARSWSWSRSGLWSRSGSRLRSWSGSRSRSGSRSVSQHGSGLWPRPRGGEVRYEGRDVCVRYPGGNIYLGHLAEATPVDLVLERPVWVSDTGRLGLFWAGKYDDNCEWEPMGEEVVIPRAHAEVGPWPHGVPTEAR